MAFLVVFKVSFNSWPHYENYIQIPLSYSQYPRHVYNNKPVDCDLPYSHLLHQVTMPSRRNNPTKPFVHDSSSSISCSSSTLDSVPVLRNSVAYVHPAHMANIVIYEAQQIESGDGSCAPDHVPINASQEYALSSISKQALNTMFGQGHTRHGHVGKPSSSGQGQEIEARK